MSRHRAHAAEFVKLLESALHPLYVLDDSLTIVYLNEACRAWLGAGTDDLLGRTCLYHSGEEKSAADRAAAGLCPPPAVLEGNEITATVSYTDGDETHFREARFLPLRWTEEPALCIIALVAGQDASEPIAESGSPAGDEPQELHSRLQRLRQRKRSHYRAHGVVGVTPAARRAAAQAELAAASDASVLIYGPPGSGRRHLGEAIHYGATGRPQGDGPIFTLPLVPLECALLDAELIQSTLRDAASAVRDGGSLLFCDVDRLPPEAQNALAAALSSGGLAGRAIATAAAPLVDLAAHGQFREDLAAALSTISIELPPLAKRRDDLPLLAQALLEEQNARGGKQLGGFAPDALDRLCAYSWPGNLTELAQVVAECHLRAAGTHVTRADLPDRLHMTAEAVLRPRRKDEPIQLDEFIARIERELIRRALARSKGNKAKAARLLGLNRPRLYRRMVQLGLIENGEAE